MVVKGLILRKRWNDSFVKRFSVPANNPRPKSRTGAAWTVEPVQMVESISPIHQTRTWISGEVRWTRSHGSFDPCEQRTLRIRLHSLRYSSIYGMFIYEDVPTYDKFFESFLISSVKTCHSDDGLNEAINDLFAQMKARVSPSADSQAFFNCRCCDLLTSFSSRIFSKALERNMLRPRLSCPCIILKWS